MTVCRRGIDKRKEIAGCDRSNTKCMLYCKDEEYMKELFRKVFMESVYPVSYLARTPEYKMGDTEVEQLRRESATKFAELKSMGKTPLSALLSVDLLFQPFQMSEAAFDIIGPYSLVAESS
ncbi:unnamed protein product [Candidula unifasciata]|uniref:Uncharacterized protein n=1 Tax=Candidula unifasciata TaxID=100452 RepID=A0A8S3ZL62_9EUPU|nr:unnamed protein product [Candidula unifasciata]